MTIPEKLAIAVGILAMAVTGCNKPATPASGTATQQPPKPLTGPPEITSESEEGFYDLVFYIQDDKKLPDGSHTIRGAGTYKGRPVGLMVVLSPSWKGGSLGRDIPLTTYGGSVTYQSVGADSDALVQVLDQLYATKLSPKAMRTEIKFTGISLEGNPADLGQGPTKIKVFYDSGEKDAYAELFTDIDLGAHRLEIHEKDEEYRPAVIKALRAP